MFRKNLHADFMKMKGLPVTIAHMIIPVVISAVFLAYYSFSGWSFFAKLTGFYQAIGAGFPVLIGIFTASIMEQEQNAGGCQNLLSLQNRTAAFLSKVVILLLFSLFSVCLTAGIFGFGCLKILGYNSLGIRVYMRTALLMWCGSIPLYIWQMFFAFRFGKGVSIGAGIVSGLISALLLTDLGMFVWRYIPASWPGRLPDTYLRMVFGDTEAAGEMKVVIPILCVLTIFSIMGYLVWAARWEGNRVSE